MDSSIYLRSSRLLIIGMVSLLIAACGSYPDRDVAPLANKGKAQIHRVKSNELKRIMHSLQNVTYNHQLNAMQVEDEKRRQAMRMAKMVSQMSRRIVGLVADKATIKLSREHRKNFIALARQLGTHGQEIRWLAKSYRIEELNPALNRMVQTCNACHNRFRNM